MSQFCTINRHRAFDALLAVAKAAEMDPLACPICRVLAGTDPHPDHMATCPYAALEPEWRTW